MARTRSQAFQLQSAQASLSHDLSFFKEEAATSIKLVTCFAGAFAVLPKPQLELQSLFYCITHFADAVGVLENLMVQADEAGQSCMTYFSILSAAPWRYQRRLFE